MPRKRNELGQYIPKNYGVSISLPSPISLFKYALIVFALSSWLFALIYRLDLKVWLYNMKENLFLINKEKGKKTNAFFELNIA